MLENKVMAESCNILQEPSCLRMELLPNELINQCLTKINQIISKYQLIKNNQVIINQRSEDLINPVITQIIFEYKTLLENYQVPDNIEEERYNLVKFIKAFETVHNNTIMDYLPEYEEFLRQYGY
jgi:hypothetical protein